MSNMSYCRFENTLRDLEDCCEALGNGEAEDSALNEYEKKAKEKLIKVCVDIACDYGDCEKN
jgi:exonuclease VII small subunit